MALLASAWRLKRVSPAVRLGRPQHISRWGTSISTDAFETAFAPHAQAIMGDIPNYTNIQPTIQISEVKM